MRLLNQMLNLSRNFNCFSRRFDKVQSQSSYLSNEIKHMGNDNSVQYY